jgi:hypothetical protein
MHGFALREEAAAKMLKMFGLYPKPPSNLGRQL